MPERLILAITLVTGLGIAVVLIATLVRAIREERRSAGLSRIWANFGLSISFFALFLISWIAQAVAEWGTRRIEKHLDDAGIGSTGSA